MVINMDNIKLWAVFLGSKHRECYEKNTIKIKK